MKRPIPWCTILCSKPLTNVVDSCCSSPLILVVQYFFDDDGDDSQVSASMKADHKPALRRRLCKSFSTPLSTSGRSDRCGVTYQCYGNPYRLSGKGFAGRKTMLPPSGDGSLLSFQMFKRKILRDGRMPIFILHPSLMTVLRRTDMTYVEYPYILRPTGLFLAATSYQQLHFVLWVFSYVWAGFTLGLSDVRL
jgi:hypothetical protein